MAKLLAADASWEAANVAVQTYGGFGFAEDYDIERKFRETRLYQVAPISTNLILDLRRGARARACRDRIETCMRCRSTGITVVVDRAGGRGAVRDAAARRSRRARDQDRAAGRRRLRARLRPDRQGAVELLRLAQPVEGVADARSEAARRAGRSSARLLERADVFVQNLAPGAADRLGTAPADLRARHPRLIVCTISGYGTSRAVRAAEGVRPAGPERGRAAVDHRHATRRRAASASPSPTSPPACTPTPASSRRSSRARRAAQGAAVDVSLFDALGEWMGAPAYYTAYGGAAPARTGGAHATIAPYELFVEPRRRRDLPRASRTRASGRASARDVLRPARRSPTIRASRPNPVRVRHRDALHGDRLPAVFASSTPRDSRSPASRPASPARAATRSATSSIIRS